MSQDETQDNDNAMTSQEDAGVTEEEGFVAEEKKPVNRSTLVVFGIIIAGLAGYYFMYLRTGPATAQASAEVAAAEQTIQQFLTDGERIKSMERMLRSTEKVVEQFKSYPSVTQIPLEDLKANPFKYLGSASDEPKGDPTAANVS